MSDRRSPKWRSEGARRVVVALIFVEAVLLMACVGMGLSDEDSSLLLPTITFFLLGACVLVDAYLFVVINRLEARQFEEQRAALLNDRLNECLSRYEAVVDGIEGVAHLRHDVRNQLHVAYALAERGQRDRACEMLEELIAHGEALIAELNAQEGGGSPAPARAFDADGGACVSAGHEQAGEAQGAFGGLGKAEPVQGKCEAAK